jgi:hypothetical protein
MPDIRARVTPERVIEGFGMDPGSARLVDGDLVEAALGYPVYGDGIEPACPYIRVGQTGEWAFAIKGLSWEGVGDAGLRLSAGTEAAVVCWTQFRIGRR